MAGDIALAPERCGHQGQNSTLDHPTEMKNILRSFRHREMLSNPIASVPLGLDPGGPNEVCRRYDVFGLGWEKPQLGSLDLQSEIL